MSSYLHCAKIWPIKDELTQINHLFTGKWPMPVKIAPNRLVKNQTDLTPATLKWI